MRIIPLLFIFASVVLLCSALSDSLHKRFAHYQQRQVRKLSHRLEDLFLFLSPQLFFSLTLVMAMLMLCVGFVLSGISLSLMLGGIGLLLPRLFLSRARRKRVERFDNQLPDALLSLSNSLKAGFTLIQSIDRLAREEPAPLSQEFGLLLKEYRLGTPLDEALFNMNKRVPSDECLLVVTALSTTRLLGGNLTEMLARIASTLRERRVYEGKIRALTAQGRLQGIVVGTLPLILGAIFSLIDPEMLRYMVNTPTGLLLLVIGGILEVCGALFIRKIINVEV